MFNDWIYQAIIEPLFEQFKCFLKAILTEAKPKIFDPPPPSTQNPGRTVQMYWVGLTVPNSMSCKLAPGTPGLLENGQEIPAGGTPAVAALVRGKG